MKVAQQTKNDNRGHHRVLNQEAQPVQSNTEGEVENKTKNINHKQDLFSRLLSYFCSHSTAVEFEI